MGDLIPRTPSNPPPESRPIKEGASERSASKAALSNQAFYKAKIPCRIGGAYRRAGDIFPLPEFETTPPFLEKMPEGAAPAPEEKPKSSPGRKPRASAPGPMPEDLPGVMRD